MKKYKYGQVFGTSLALNLIQRDPRLQLVDYNATKYFNEIIEGKDAVLFYHPLTNDALGITDVDELGVSIAIHDGITNKNKENFTIAHEIGHLLFHVKSTKYNQSFIDNEQSLNLSDISISLIKEIEANSFAAHFMLPYKVLKNQINSEFTIRQIKRSTGLSLESIKWQIINMLVGVYEINQTTATLLCEEYSQYRHHYEVRNCNLRMVICGNMNLALNFSENNKNLKIKNNQLIHVSKYIENNLNGITNK